MRQVSTSTTPQGRRGKANKEETRTMKSPKEEKDKHRKATSKE